MDNRVKLYKEGMMSEYVFLKVKRISCGYCVKAINKALYKQTGVISSWVSLEEKIAAIDYDPSLVTPAQLREVIVNCGYEVNA